MQEGNKTQTNTRDGSLNTENEEQNGLENKQPDNTTNGPLDNQETQGADGDKTPKDPTKETGLLQKISNSFITIGKAILSPLIWLFRLPVKLFNGAKNFVKNLFSKKPKEPEQEKKDPQQGQNEQQQQTQQKGQNEEKKQEQKNQVNQQQQTMYPQQNQTTNQPTNQRGPQQTGYNQGQQGPPQNKQPRTYRDESSSFYDGGMVYGGGSNKYNPEEWLRNNIYVLDKDECGLNNHEARIRGKLEGLGLKSGADFLKEINEGKLQKIVLEEKSLDIQKEIDQIEKTIRINKGIIDSKTKNLGFLNEKLQEDRAKVEGWKNELKDIKETKGERAQELTQNIKTHETVIISLEKGVQTAQSELDSSLKLKERFSLDLEGKKEELKEVEKQITDQQINETISGMKSFQDKVKETDGITFIKEDDPLKTAHSNLSEEIKEVQEQFKQAEKDVQQTVANHKAQNTVQQQKGNSKGPQM